MSNPTDTAGPLRQFQIRTPRGTNVYSFRGDGFIKLYFVASDTTISMVRLSETRLFVSRQYGQHYDLLGITDCHDRYWAKFIQALQGSTESGPEQQQYILNADQMLEGLLDEPYLIVEPTFEDYNNVIQRLTAEDRKVCFEVYGISMPPERFKANATKEAPTNEENEGETMMTVQVRAVNANTMQLLTDTVNLIAVLRPNGQVVAYDYFGKVPYVTQHNFKAIFERLMLYSLGGVDVQEVETTSTQLLTDLGRSNSPQVSTTQANHMEVFNQTLQENEIRLFNIQPSAAVAVATPPRTGNTVDQMRESLQRGIVYQVFEKVGNLSVRPMLCTLNADLIRNVAPAQLAQAAEETSRRAGRDKPNLLRVFDLVRGEFRSFYTDKVIAFDSPMVQQHRLLGMESKNQFGLMWFEFPVNTQWNAVLTGATSLDDFVGAQFGLAPSTPQVQALGAQVPTPATESAGSVASNAATATVVNGATVLDTHTRALIAIMESRVTTITFEKQNGELREMQATRSIQASDKYRTLNLPNEIERQISSNKISVWDMSINEERNFNPNRLVSYIDGGGNYVNVDAAVLEAENAVAQAGGVENPFPYAPDVYTVQEMAAVLADNVVRLRFERSAGGDRVMFATRNQSLIQTYEKIGHVDVETQTEPQSQEDRIAEMLASRVIKVFDIESQEWRSFKVDSILPYDVQSNIPSWVEFEWEIGDWFAVMRGNKLAAESYAGTQFKGKDMFPIDRERFRFESKQFKYQVRKADVTLTETSDYLERIRIATELKDRALATVDPKALTSQDLEVFEQLKHFADGLESSWKEALGSSTENSSLVFSSKKEYATTKLIVLTYNWGREVLFLHPRFIVNAASHKVYADRTEVLNFQRAKTTVVDTLLGPALETLAPLITGRRKADLFRKPLEQVDVRRFARLLQLIKHDKTTLAELKIGFNRSKDLPTQIRVSYDRKATYLLNPEYIYDQRSRQFVFIRTPENTYQSDIEPKVKSVVHPQTARVLALYLHACDLRRTVKDDKGNPM